MNTDKLAPATGETGLVPAKNSGDIARLSRRLRGLRRAGLVYAHDTVQVWSRWDVSRDRHPGSDEAVNQVAGKIKQGEGYSAERCQRSGSR